MRQLQQDTGLADLFISHDMAAIERMSLDVAVMRAGRIVEQGARRAVFETPARAYAALIAAVPSPRALDRLSRISEKWLPVFGQKSCSNKHS